MGRRSNEKARQPRRISLKQLKAALRRGGMIDASALVLGMPDAALSFSDRTRGVHKPPFLVAACEFEPFGEEPENRRTGIRDFERLSLAARVALTVGPNPPADHPFATTVKQAKLNIDAFPVVDPEDILEALAWVADELGPDQGRGGSAATAEQLAMRGGLQLIGCRIAQTRRGRGEDGLRLVNARQPISLRLIGCVIECPVLLAHCELVSLDLSGSALNSLDATGLKASGSVHLRRTVVRTPVSFAGARIAGSLNASDAVFAPFAMVIRQTPIEPDHGMLNLSKATIENEVRLDQARIWGGLSLRGTTIGRSLFLNRAMLISPIGLIEKRLFDLLTAAKVTIAKDDVGGQIARGDAALAERLHSPTRPSPAIEPPPGALWGDSACWGQISRALQEAEVLQGETGRWRFLTTRTLNKLRARALVSAVRADGLKVKGSVFARAVTCNGLFRMKYAEIDGGLRFEGARFRSAASILRTLVDRLKSEPGDPRLVKYERLQVKGGGKENGRKAGWRIRDALTTLMARDDFLPNWEDERPEVALDLRDTRLAGDLSLGPANPREAGRDPLVTRPPWRSRKGRVDLHGRINMDGLRTSGSIILCGLTWDTLRPGQVTGAERAAFTGVSHEAPPAPTEAAAGPGRDDLEGDELTLAALFGPGRSERPGLMRFARWLMRGRTLNKVGQPDKGWARFQRARMKTAAGFSVISMRQARVGRDIDLRATRNVHGVDMENVEIGGDLYFADKSNGRTRENSLQAGFITCAHRAEAVRGTINLRAARVAGDAFLVFDAREGPVIKAGMAKIGGRLDIYPQLDGRTYQSPVKDRRPPTEDGETLSGFWLDSCSHQGRYKSGAVRDDGTHQTPGQFCEHCGLMLSKVEDHLAWFIDLRHARASVFAHPPAAWPDPGALSLDGFVYQQTSDLGPLAPKPQLVEHQKVHYERGRLAFAWRHNPALRRRDTLLAVAALGAITLTLGLFGWWLARTAAPYFGVTAVPVPTLTISLAVSLFLLWRVLGSITPSPGQRSRTGLFDTGTRDSTPRAIEYLARQRVSESRFKWRPSTYHVLDSYSRAAKALREAGRYISANLVEQARLRRRTEMLSWRHHGMAKLILRLVDLFAGYGFALSRAVMLSGVIVCAVAGLSHWAAANDYLVVKPAAEVPLAEGRPPPVPVVEFGKCDSSRTAASIDQDCPDLIYAADLLLPFIDLGEETRWATQIPEDAEKDILRLWEPWQSLWVSLLRSWPALVSILGLMLSGVLLTAMAARIESAFSRVEE
ncbi:hypothetical protein [Brevundimonas sp.]|uniref:hypothetical protein n=1 Tax=Brevundimonas sp. TaxID=1871086 RepID=UPI0026381E8C|nr:hypothetical protein [Brevundimonas sp.]